MDEPKSKRCKSTEDKLLKGKVQNLPLLCVDSICRFTATSNLTRLHSNAVPLPGAFWNVGVEAALRKRLPLSIRHDLSYYQADAPVAIFDAAGAKVADIKYPGMFRFSPLLELIERASLTVIGVLATTVFDMQMYVAHGEDILSHMPNVTELQLSLVLQDVSAANQEKAVQHKGLLKSELKHLLPNLRSLGVRVSDDVVSTQRLNFIFAVYMCEVALRELARLRHLDVPEGIFNNILQRSGATNATVRRVLSELRSLGVSNDSWFYGEWRYTRPGILRFVSAHCSQLTTLTVVVQDDFKVYQTAFRALTSLSSLGLFLMFDGLNEISFNECDTIGSVLDLRLRVSDPYVPRARELAIASLFPNTKSLALQRGEASRDVLVLAAEFCTKRVLPAVEKLSCFYLGAFSDGTGRNLTKFLASSSLPEAVDLSPMIFSALATEPGLLTDIYRAMQSNSTRSMLMRGPEHAKVLSNLQGHVDLNGEKPKLTTWKDRDLGEQPGILNLKDISQQTEFKIIGTKTDGRLKSERFTIRVIHQLAKRSGIF